MVIPSVQFNPKTVLNIQDVDQSIEFITKCGGHEFAIKYVLTFNTSSLSFVMYF